MFIYQLLQYPFHNSRSSTLSFDVDKYALDRLHFRETQFVTIKSTADVI